MLAVVINYKFEMRKASKVLALAAGTASALDVDLVPSFQSGPGDIFSASVTECTHFLTKDNSRSVTVNYVPASNNVLITAVVAVGSYTGFGWGGDMTNTEMIIFSADATTPSIGYYYSKTEEPPTTDSALDNCYSNA